MVPGKQQAGLQCHSWLDGTRSRITPSLGVLLSLIQP